MPAGERMIAAFPAEPLARTQSSRSIASFYKEEGGSLPRHCGDIAVRRLRFCKHYIGDVLHGWRSKFSGRDAHPSHLAHTSNPSAGLVLGGTRDGTDPISSPMKAKGAAELGICGVAAAVANAIYNASGVRVRDYPITLDKLLDRLPQVG
jgi:hypothetical protein